MKQTETPRDDASERAIISIILNSPEKILEVVDLIHTTDFFITTHQQIWEAMVNLFKEGRDLDIVSIKSQLRKNEVDVAPALSALAECYEDVVANSNLINFIRQVKNKSLLRQIITISTTHTYNAQIQDAEANIVLQELQKDLVLVADTNVESRPIDAEGIIREVRADIAKSEDRGWQGFETGFPRLDQLTGGFIPTQTWIVGAYTGGGKSFTILQMLLNTLKQGAKVMLFSTEMDRKINMLRLIGNIAGYGTIQLMRGNLLANEKEDVERAEKQLEGYKDNLIIYDNVYTLEDIKLKAKKAKITNGLNIVAVDFIQNLRGKESIYERMAEAAVGLQQLAQELDITIIIGSQISQAAAGWQSKQAIEFKGAGEIAAVADVALWIDKVDGKNVGRKLTIRKIRHGEPGYLYVRMEFPGGRVIDTGSNIFI